MNVSKPVLSVGRLNAAGFTLHLAPEDAYLQKGKKVPLRRDNEVFFLDVKVFRIPGQAGGKTITPFEQDPYPAAARSSEPSSGSGETPVRLGSADVSEEVLPRAPTLPVVPSAEERHALITGAPRAHPPPVSLMVPPLSSGAGQRRGSPYPWG